MNCSEQRVVDTRLEFVFFASGSGRRFQMVEKPSQNELQVSWSGQLSVGMSAYVLMLYIDVRRFEGTYSFTH